MDTKYDTKDKLKGEENGSFAERISPVKENIDDNLDTVSSAALNPGELGEWTYADAMRRAVDQIPEAFWQMDRHLKLAYINPAFEKILGGFPAGELLGKSLFEFLTPEGIKQLRYHLTARQKEEESGIQTDILFFELQIRRMDGSYLWAGITSSPIRDTKGRIDGYQGILHDISYFKKHQDERIRLEDLLKKTERMASLGEISGSVAHELNNIVAGILGYTELMMLQPSEDGISRDHLINIIGGGNKAVAIIQDVMMMSRKEDEGSRALNINDLIKTCLEKTEIQAIIQRNGKVDVRLDLETALHNVIASSSRLGKALTDLIALSIEQAGMKGRVLIKTQMLYLGVPINETGNVCEGEYVSLSLADEGEGIPDEALSHLFEPFYVKKVLGRGVTGLELPIIREVVKDHDGFIDVWSRVGNGTTYTLYLPVMRGKRQASCPTQPSFYTDAKNMIN